MLQAEKRSLISFLALYGVSTTLFLIVISVIYYDYQKKTIFSDKLQSMQVYSDKVEASIREVKKVAAIDSHYAEDPRYEIALYDDKFKLIYGTFSSQIDWSINFYTKDDYVFYIDKMDLHYLKIHYIVIRGHNLDDMLLDVRERLYITISVSFIFILIMAYFLAKAFLRPLRDAIAKMDEFIKDTTHELNTPLSAILMSIETINMQKLDVATRKKLGRIAIASRTISTLYQALSFSAMHGKLKSKDETFDIKNLITERIDYFEPLANAKNVSIVATLDSFFISMDKLKMQIVIDNLLSNAIKYNKKNGSIFVILNVEFLSVTDEGVGIGLIKVNDLFARYTRFDSATGGFGLGLSIVKSICDEYRISITVNSSPNEGATFKLKWPIVNRILTI